VSFLSLFFHMQTNSRQKNMSKLAYTLNKKFYVMTNLNLSLAQLPSPAAKRIAMRVSAPAERALHQGHPWIYDQAIIEQSHEGAPGDLAVIFDNKRRFVAIGLYDPTSSIRVRILQHRQPATINENWFQAKLIPANQLREPLTRQATDGYRLVHGENDGLPGLVIDRYADTLVIKIYSPIWIPHLKEFCSALLQTNACKHLILRLSRSLAKQREHLFGLADGMTLAGQATEELILFRENGLTFECDPIHGQKTGFFLDQRDNRARVEKLSKGKSILNVFAYTGGFSVYAARGGAKQVVSVDISAPALQAAIHNFSHNQHIPTVKSAIHETIAEDAFEVLARMESQKRLFDLVIIDPPMFAQNQNQIAAGLSAYRKLTHLGLGVLRSGGILVQASCSSRIDTGTFFDTVHQSSKESHRRLTEIERTGHALDHPITFEEGAYLKCLFATAS
jgi:23S rRNA (cytosine1962-C5)-methyltransferase